MALQHGLLMEAVTSEHDAARNLISFIAPDKEQGDGDKEEVDLVVESDNNTENKAPAGHPTAVQSLSDGLSVTDGIQKELRERRTPRCFECCQRTNAAHCCIDDCIVEYVPDEKGGHDARLEVVFVPEAFRMWFYYGWWIFITLAIVISIIFADIPYDDNPFIKYFNGLSICIFFDFPPFSYFGALLWMPQIFNLLAYEIFDTFRVYDNYLDGEKNPNIDENNKISWTFFKWYFASAVFECFGFISFIQTMATSPDENWQVHAVPYLIMTYGLWTMSFKRWMYLKRTGKLAEALSSSTSAKYMKCKLCGGYVYMFFLWLAMFLKTSILWPNFFGAMLWTQPGFAWTDRTLQYSVYFWFFLTLIVPIVIYWVITDDLDTVKCVLNRHSFSKTKKSP